MSLVKEKVTDEVNVYGIHLNYKRKKCVLGAVENVTRDAQCPAWGKTCFKCNNKNHFSRHYKNKQRRNMSHYLQETHYMLLLSTRYSNYKPYTCKLELNGVQCDSDKQKTV